MSSSRSPSVTSSADPRQRNRKRLPKLPNVRGTIMSGWCRFKGLGMVILQILRVATIITLLTAAAASWVIIIRIEQNRNYFVFECISLAINSLFCILLICSELPFVEAIKMFFRSHLPLLSDHHGLTWLGTGMVVIGCNILARLNYVSRYRLYTEFWSLIQAAGILSIAFGCLNIICSLIWRGRGRDGERNLTARDIRADGSLAKAPYAPESHYAPSSHGSSIKNEKPKGKFFNMFWKGGKKKGSPKAEKKQRPNISGPYYDEDVEAQHYDEDDHRGSPIAPGIRRPESALHPMHDRHSSYSDVNMQSY